MKRFIIFGLCVLFTTITVGQSEILKVAQKHVQDGNYIAAKKIYKRIADKDTTNAVANYGAGYCILNIAGNKKEAVKYLERSIAAGIKDPDAYYHLGTAYLFAYDYDMSSAAYQEYKNAGNGNYMAQVSRRLDMVDNARKLVDAPVNVEFENLGDKINTEHPDYYPFISANESLLVYTSRRKKNVQARLEFDGFYPSDIWISRVVEGEFQTSYNPGKPLNTPLDEQVVGMSADGDRLFVYMDNIKEFGDIYYSDFKEGEYEAKKRFEDVINSEHFESSATASVDEKTLFFVSSRPGGYGGKDIYMTRKLPTGNWAKPQNLGDKINTAEDEDFPNLFYDGKTMYFASNGHNSIGGYDLFESTWDPDKNTWTQPKNLGFPINTPDDELSITFTKDQKYAYTSRWRPDSKGNLDIYSIKFLDEDPRQTVFKCKIRQANTENVVKNAFIIVTDNRTEEEIGNFIPDPNNGNIIIPLAPGSYNIIIDADGYQNLMEDIIVKGKSDFKEFQLKEFIIQK